MTGEKGPSNKPKPITYALMQSFSYASHRTRTSQAPLSCIAPYVSVPGVPRTATLKTRASTLHLCSVLVVTSAGDWHVERACDPEMDGVAVLSCVCATSM